MKKVELAAIALLLGMSSIAAAAPAITVTPPRVRPGAPVLVTVAGTARPPRGEVGGIDLQFFPTKSGYQALFAVPLTAEPGPMAIEIDGAAKAARVAVESYTFPDTDVVVEDELANPDKPDRDRIDADNAAIVDVARAKGLPLFTRAFRRPPGEVNSPFGVWRTFNDGHRSQHLGIDLFAKEGSKVRAINAGKVVLVRDTFLAGTIVVVSHGAGIASAYYHLSKPLVAVGDPVELGTVIGLAGHTGRTTGPHLHLSVRVPGGFVDPAAFFELAIATPREAAR